MEGGRLHQDLSPATCRSPDWSCSAFFPRSFCDQCLNLLGPVNLGISFSEHRTYYNLDGLNHIDHIPGTKFDWFELVNITQITLFHICPQLKMFGSLHPASLGSLGNYYESSQIWAQTCDLYKSSSHKFGRKVTSLYWKVTSLVWSQTCGLSKAHKFRPKLVTFWNLTSLNFWPFVKVTSLDPNLWPFLIIPNCSIETSQGFFLNKAHCKPCPSLPKQLGVGYIATSQWF